MLKVYSRDDKIIRTERNILKGAKADRYSICSKGILVGRLPELPERILYPMKRVGERGEGKFERITWDQAYIEISAKMREITAKYGPRSIVLNRFSSGMPLNMQGSLGCALSTRFVHTSDCTGMIIQPVDVSSFQNGLVDFGDSLFFTHFNPYYWVKHRPNYILLWGGNPIGYTRAARTTQMFLDAQDAGTKIVTVGLFYDSTAAKSDEFVGVKAGTDAALALAMCNILIQEGTYNVDFLIKHTVAPFLVREDDGKFLRRRDVAACDEEQGGDYVAWDSQANAPLFISRAAEGARSSAFSAGSEASDDPAASGPAMTADSTSDIHAEVTIAGIACKTAFVKTAEHVAEWTPEAQEKVTGVPAETVRHLVHDFMEHMPSGVFTYLGMRYRNGGHSVRAVNLFAILSGCIAEENGRLLHCAVSDGHLTLLDFGISVPNFDMAAVKGGSIQIHEIIESFENPDVQQYKVLINAYANPLQNWPNRQMWAEKVFPNLDLIIVNEIRETDTAMFADYILPEASILERAEISAPTGDCMVLCEPAVPPVGESKDTADLWRFLAKCAGVEEYFQYSTEEWLRFKLQAPAPEIEGITWERLCEEKIIPLNVPDDVDDIVWKNMNFPTLTGRIEFYNEAFAHLGLAVASFVPTKIHDAERREKFPLHYFPGRSRFFMQGQFHEYPELRELAGHKSTVGLNPRLARERGIAEGDLVEVFNDYGSCQAWAHLSQSIPPDMAHFWYAYPAKDYLTDPPTVLSAPMGIDDTMDAFAAQCHELDAQITAGIPPTLLLTFPSANENLWDELVDVRKV